MEKAKLSDGKKISGPQGSGGEGDEHSEPKRFLEQKIRLCDTVIVGICLFTCPSP